MQTPLYTGVYFLRRLRSVICNMGNFGQLPYSLGLYSNYMVIAH